MLFEAESLCSPELLVFFEHPLPSFFFLYPFHSNRSISGEVQSKSGDDAAFTSWLVNLKQKLAVFKDEAKLDLQHEQKSTESKGFQSMSESDDPGKSKKKKKKDKPPRSRASHVSKGTRKSKKSTSSSSGENQEISFKTPPLKNCWSTSLLFSQGCFLTVCLLIAQMMQETSPC